MRAVICLLLSISVYFSQAQKLERLKITTTPSVSLFSIECNYPECRVIQLQVNDSAGRNLVRYYNDQYGDSLVVIGDTLTALKKIVTYISNYYRERQIEDEKRFLKIDAYKPKEQR